MTDKGCGNCYYESFDERAYPCSLCIRGVKRTDRWQPKGRETKQEAIIPPPRVEGRRTEDYCKTCTRKGCEYCTADSNPYCVPSHYEEKAGRSSE